MGDRIRMGNVTGSVVAAGRHATAQGAVGGGTESAAARAELVRLIEDLRAREEPEALPALRHAENLDEAFGDGEPAAAERSWSKLNAALVGLTVTANMAQIGQLVQALLHG